MSGEQAMLVVRVEGHSRSFACVVMLSLEDEFIIGDRQGKDGEGEVVVVLKKVRWWWWWRR